MKLNKRVLKAAFISSLPVLMGYSVMGIGFGVLLNSVANLNALWAALISSLTVSGAMQYAEVELLTRWHDISSVIILTILINLRYAMYGLSLIERFRGVGFWLKCYLILTLTDETFALQVENRVPPGESSLTYCFLVAVFNHCYWILGGVLGVIIGENLPYVPKGVEFTMTALFLVILTEQAQKREHHWPILIGLVVTLCSRLVVGAEHMLLVAICGILFLLIALRRKLESHKEGLR